MRDDCAAIAWPESTKKPPHQERLRLAMIAGIAQQCTSKHQKKRIVLPGIELFSQGATPQISSPLLRFTTEFEMDRSGTTAPWTPG